MISIPNLDKSNFSNSQPHSQSILKVDLRAEQNFGLNPIQKISVPFKREEDMILLCLSIFLHDFVHDYNLSSMHKRVIKGDAYKVFQSLNIGIRNPTFKLFSYNTGSYGDVELYDDSKFEDVPVTLGSNLESYVKFIQENKLEKPIQIGGLAPFAKIPYEADSMFKDLDKFKLKPDLHLEKEPIEDFLTYPIVSDFTSSETYKTLIDHFSNNADFLGFHSALNTYVVTYLGSNLDNEAPEFSALVTPEVEPKSIEMHNLSMFNYILCSIDKICFDFSALSTDLSFFADVFRVLRRAFVSVFDKAKDNLKTDPLLILNSSGVLQQFIIYYALFLNQSDMAEFDSIVKQSGGQGEEEDEEEEEKEKPPYMILDTDTTGQFETRAYPEGVDTYLAKPDKKIYLGTESIFITHNNLLTTIARGMFVKLGLWDKLFAGVDGYSKEDGSLYNFGIKEMDMISYDKLVELFPTNPWAKKDGTRANGSFNNELLIMQILILKNLLIEMSPSKTLTFGAKIDDQLKNYLDVFYNTYFVSKNQKTDAPPVQMDDDVLNNPNPEASIGSDTASLLASSGNEDEEEEVDPFLDDEDDLSGGQPGEIEMVELKKTEPESQPELELELEIESDVKAEPLESDKEIEQLPEVSLSNDTIVEPGRPPTMPIVFKNLKKMYQNNIYIIQNLKSIQIPLIELGGTKKIDNLYDLLAHNETLMHRTDSQFNIPAPAFKFVINNAANIAANINGSKMLYTKKDKDEMKKIVDEVKKISDFNEALANVIEEYNINVTKITPFENREKQLKELKRQNRITIREYNELLQTQFEIKKIRNRDLVPCENKKYLIEKVVKLNNEELQKGTRWLDEWSKNCEIWFNQCQAIFGLYRNLARGTFCPTVSMMDAMFNCSLKYKATEPKEVGTTNFELKYENEDGGRSISFGGVVLNYNESVNGIEQLNAKIDFDLICVDKAKEVNDVANISTTGMQVAESHDLKASVVYKSVVDKIKELYLASFGISTEEDTPPLDLKDRAAREKFLEAKINRMWSSVQMYNNPENFNKLLGATAVKTFGDFLQECMACMKWGGYVNSTEQFPSGIKNFIQESGIVPIYRSVSDANKIVPYDLNGNALRLGIQGDRPSGFRSIYILMNGESGINEYSIGGYVYTSANQKASRSILVARDELAKPKKDGLRGKVIYVTRELPIIREDRDRYLKLLQYKTIRERRNFADKVTKEVLVPEIDDFTIEGTSTETGYTLLRPPANVSSLEEPYKTSNYNEWDDYETPRILTETKNKLYDFIDPREAEEKARKAAAAAQEREKIAEEKASERAITNSELYGMREEEKGTRGYMKDEGEVVERDKLSSTSISDLTLAEKARLTKLKKKYPNGGRSKRKRKNSGKRKLSHKRAPSKKEKRKHTRKHMSNKKRKHTKKR